MAMRRINLFWRDRGGLAGADFALIAALLFAGRHVAMAHGSQMADLMGALLPN